ncbi:MAG: efflux RND transporter periplasmic adaptor subunit [Paracoccaceae bacterium]
MRFVMFLSGLAAATAFATPLLAETTAPAAPAAQVLPAISVSVVETRLLRDRVIVSGLVGPVEQVQVQPLIEGQPIETLEADVGDIVTAGQVLARLSPSSLVLQKSQLAASLASARATIAQAQAQQLEAASTADEAQRVNERTAALRDQGSASQAAADKAQSAAISATAGVTVAAQSLEAARAQLALVEAQIANVELQLSRTEVKAPVAGEIVERNALVGSIATAAGKAMFVLIKDSALELRADVAEADLMRLAPGQTARMVAVGTPEPLVGTVRLVEPSIDTTTRLGRARITLDAPEMLRSGMFVDAEILVAERETIAVPVTAVGSSSAGISVMRVKDGTVSRIMVKTGIRDGGWVEILEGLAVGDTVVTKAGAFVRDGDRINPVPATPATN